MGPVPTRPSPPWRPLATLGYPGPSLERLADADAFAGTLGLSRRDALWAVRALGDEPLPLFAAAAVRDNATVLEVVEPTAVFAPMTAGREVVEDYTHVGLTLRRHPVSFLRQDLRRGSMAPCVELAHARDGQRLTVAGLVLVRQKPGSAKGVLFITIEDETGQANLVIWPKLFQQNRRLILSASGLAARSRV